MHLLNAQSLWGRSFPRSPVTWHMFDTMKLEPRPGPGLPVFRDMTRISSPRLLLPKSTKEEDDASMSTVTTSSLTTLMRTPTPASNESDTRYQTASEGTAATVTEPSSPGEAGQDTAGKTPYRDALDLPYELKSRCHIHLEEQCCKCGKQPPEFVLCQGAS